MQASFLDQSMGSYAFIDTTEALEEMLNALEPLPATPSSLYIDLEGENLSRHGNVALLQQHVLPTLRTYLIDITALKHEAFNTPGTKGHTFKDILESETIPKVFFDVRNDSDALYSHFQVKLTGVQDLQLMELAARLGGRSKKCVNGLTRSIENDALLTPIEKASWKSAKERGLTLFAPQRGGSYRVFSDRPLAEAIRIYCVQDVQFLPRLWAHYALRLTPTWNNRVQQASADRVAQSQTPGFNGKGRHMALAPAGWW
ncbi:Uu.00g034200.m01.CDS01 [Anthostomella pinea]|uniref:Uu.00g034200.m01.CDS01 n=1 Tax=Anthostomella pinea TaxID=933095 RepID=A0AAI8YDC2_9PEZI|nr:Uu.00g034200.m01.CDS01 [Anthostomella pinea]